jgi:hypothetical protein
MERLALVRMLPEEPGQLALVLRAGRVVRKNLAAGSGPKMIPGLIGGWLVAPLREIVQGGDSGCILVRLRHAWTNPGVAATMEHPIRALK